MRPRAAVCVDALPRTGKTGFRDRKGPTCLYALSRHRYVLMNTEDSRDSAKLDSLVPSTDTEVQATAFVQSLGPVASKESQDMLLGELDDLADRGVLAGIDLVVWGNSVCTESPAADIGSGRRVVDAIADFHELTADSPLSIAPFFRVSTVTTAYSDRDFRRIVPPNRAVALYVAGDLAAVFPCLIDGAVYTPDDLVAYLSRQGSPAPEQLLVDESA